MRYMPALDGLRALAVVLVVLLHAHVPGFSGGAIGVDVFFVLSGYLITSILLDEHSRSGSIGLSSFYLRRVRRLYPALLLFLAAYMVYAPILWPGKPHGRDAFIAGLYLSDYALAFWEIPWYLGHTWSLASEEHFYLLWPPLLILLLRRRGALELASWLAAAMVVEWLWRLTNHYYLWGRVGYRFDTRMTGMLAGCWMAATIAYRPAWLHRVNPAIVGWMGVALLSVIVVFRNTETIDALLNLPLPELVGVGLVFGANALPLSHPALVYLGRLSYGIYLWHFPMAMALHSGPWWLTAPIILGASILMAAVSFHTVEAWTRRPRTQRIPDSCQPAP